MARKKSAAPEEKRAAADYYKLNLKAVDDLVTASPENSPRVSEKELRKYRSGLKLRLPAWLKAALIKLWFNGATCFFFFWGLGIYVTSQLDQLVILALALGFITDLLTNNVLRFYAPTKGANDRYMMFPRKGYASLPLNVVYAAWILFCVVNTYNAINTALVGLSGAKDSVPLGVGPILFGTFAMAWDFLFLAMKRTARRILEDAKKTAGGGSKGA